MSHQNEIAILVDQARGNQAEAQSAASRLVAIGMPAVPAVIVALRESGNAASKTLRDILPEIQTPEVLPELIPLLREKNNFLQLVAFQALGKSKDTRAFQPVLDQFLDNNQSDSTRYWAADALGELGDSRAVAELRRVLDQISHADELEYRAPLVLHIAIALARLGNHEGLGPTVSLSQHADTNIRAFAVGTLKYLVGPGLFVTLERALSDDSVDCRKEAIDGLFYLGLRESLATLIGQVQGMASVPDLFEKVTGRVRSLAGGALGNDVPNEELPLWWAQHQSNFAAGVSYRLGHPLRVAEIVELLNTKTPGQRYWLFEELRVITGLTFGLSQFKPATEQDDAVARARAWATAEADRFQPGAVYKFGYKQDLASISDSR